MQTNKKGQLSIGSNLLVVGVLILVVAGFIATLGANMNSELAETFVDGTAGCNSTDTDSCGADYNATMNSNEGIENVSEKFDLTGTILVMVFLLSLIFLAVAVFQGQ